MAKKLRISSTVAIFLTVFTAIFAYSILEKSSQAAESVMSEEQWVMSVYQKGKEAYDAGNYPGAVAEWDKLKGTLDRYPAFQVMVDYLQGRAKNITEEQVSQVDEKLAERQKTIDTIFKKGKALYDQGRYEQAIAQWDGLDSYLAEDSTLRRLLKDFKKYASQPAPQKAAASPPTMSLEESAEMRDFFETASKDLQRKTEQAQATILSTDMEADNALKDAYEKSKLLYYQGNYEGALESLEKVASFFVQNSPERRAIDKLVLSYHQSVSSQKEADKVISRKNLKFLPSEDFSKFIAMADEKFAAQIKESEAERIQSEKTQVDQKDWAEKDLQKGMDLLKQGKTDEAIALWQNSAPLLKNNAALTQLIDKVRKGQAELDRAKAAAAEAEAAKNARLKIPSDVERLLMSAQQKLKKQSDELEQKRASAAKVLSDRQNLLDNTFEKGKNLYEAGKYAEAAKEWSVMTTEFQDGGKIKALMQDVETRTQDLAAAKTAAETAEAQKDAKSTAPAELPKLLADLSLKLKTQTEAAVARKQVSEQVRSEKQAKVDAIFIKGKKAMDAGNVPEAVLDWMDLLPLLENGPELQTTLKSISAAYEESLKVQQAAQESDAKKDSKLATPEDLTQAINDISANLKAQTEAAAARKKQAEEALENRKTLVKNTYLKGKQFYDEGKHADALREWSTILSNLEEGTKLQFMLDQASLDAKKLEDMQKAAAQAEIAKDAKLKEPENLEKFLTDSRDALSMQTASAAAQKKKSEEYLAEREKQVAETIEKGNAFFEQGRWDEAKTTWLSVAEVLEDPAVLQNTIAELEKVYQQRSQQQKIIDDAAKWKDIRFKTPALITNELAESKARVLKMSQEADKKRADAEIYLQNRQLEVQKAFDKGKELFWNGKIADAIQQWVSVEPYLEDPEMQRAIRSVADRYEDLLKIQQGADAAELKKESKLKAPEELPKLLQDAHQIIESQTQYAETQKKLADQTFVDRQTLINSTFQKGKTLYEQDRIPEALEEWAAITPYLEKGSQIKQFIDNVSTNYNNSLVAKKVAEQAQVKQTVKFQEPPELSALLEEASQKLRAQVDDSKMQKEAAERARADRQAFVDANFEKGKSFYQQGRISEAVVAWTALIPYIEDDAKIRQLILKVEENRRALEDAKKAEEAPVAPAPAVSVPSPKEFEKVLQDSGEKLEKSAKEKKRDTLERDVQKVIQGKKGVPAKAVIAESRPIPLDEIEQMMIEYNVSTPAEIQKRHEELKAVK